MQIPTTPPSTRDSVTAATSLDTSRPTVKPQRDADDAQPENTTMATKIVQSSRDQSHERACNGCGYPEVFQPSCEGGPLGKAVPLYPDGDSRLCCSLRQQGWRSTLGG
ncbi:hypothetical protein E4U52_001020 [Claviceps spartinae]|nr:hypothetical protein E4U52_001020 [Claviceps spartinae]